MTEAQLLQKAKEFLARVTGFVPISPMRHAIAELRSRNQWDVWSSQPGIYYFVRQDEVVYVGRAMPSVGVGNRVGTHLETISDPAWKEIIDDLETVVGVLQFPADDWHWLAALEAHLIDGKDRPHFNKRF